MKISGDFNLNVKHIYNEKDLFSATGTDINDNTGEFGTNARNQFYTQLQHFYGPFMSYVDVFYYGEGKSITIGITMSNQISMLY